MIGILKLGHQCFNFGHQCFNWVKYTTLAYAVDNNDSKTVDKLLSIGMVPTEIQLYNLLLSTIKRRQLDIIVSLLNHGTNPNGVDQYRHAPLLNAITFSGVFGQRSGSSTPYEDIIQLLLEYGADPNGFGFTNNGITPMMNATMAGSLYSMQILFVGGGNLDTTDKDGNTLLHLSIGHGINKVQWLLDNGADPNILNTRGFSAFRKACWEGLLEYAEILLYNGANINASDKNGDTILHLARKYNKDIIQWLLDNGADLEARDSSEKTPLHIICQKEYLEYAEMFIASGSNINAIDEDGNTALHLLVSTSINFDQTLGEYNDLERQYRYDRVNFIRLLLDNDANLDARNISDETPLHIACFGGCITSVKQLISNGANISSINKSGMTPLHIAMMPYPQSDLDNTKSKAEIVQHLLDKGADPNTLCINRQPPLHLAATIYNMVYYNIGSGGDYWTTTKSINYLSDLENIIALVKGGANINFVDLNGNSILHKVAGLKSKDEKSVNIVQWLIKNGITPDQPNNEGKRPLDIATSVYNFSIIDILINYSP